MSLEIYTLLAIFILALLSPALLMWYVLGLMFTAKDYIVSSSCMILIFVAIVASSTSSSTLSISLSDSNNLCNLGLSIAIGSFLLLTASLLTHYPNRLLIASCTTGTLVAGVALSLLSSPTWPASLTSLSICLIFCQAWSCVCYLELWVSTSLEMIRNAEINIFRLSGPNTVKLLVVAGLGTTEVFDMELREEGSGAGKAEKPVLVLVHGYGGANAYWALSGMKLTEKFKVYCLELPLFGRSSRKDLCTSSPEQWLQAMSDAIDKWSLDMGLTKFVLLGHSMGAHAAAAFTVRFPHRVLRLFLASPVAVGVSPCTSRFSAEWTAFFWELICWRYSCIMDYVRFLGPLGQAVVRWGFLRRVNNSHPLSSLRVFSPEYLQALADYTYLHWAMPNTGKNVLQTMLYPYLPYGRKPLIDWLPPSKHGYHHDSAIDNIAEDARLVVPLQLSRNLSEENKMNNPFPPVSIIYGSPTQDWMDSKYGFELVKALEKDGVTAKVYQLSRSGHLLMLDEPAEFASVLISDCSLSNINTS